MDADLHQRFRLKFWLDRVVSGAALPAVLFIALLVKLAMVAEGLRDPRSRGPLFYVEERWSQGRPFQLFKFRTTFPGSQLAGEVGSITRVGHFLKAYYLDELPQFLNVVRGEMTLVGPRPNVPWKAQKEIHEEGMVSKLILRAGLTGMVQVQKGDAQDRGIYRSLEDEYLDEVRHRNAWQVVWLDVELLFKTLPFILRGEGL
jgi:lipopolysaccharide/colanic/teichoic acid biosynthesis glycosyltransferase